MKTILTHVFLLLSAHYFAQNLTASNGGFENYSQCPNNFSQATYANGVSFCIGTSDYVHNNNGCAGFDPCSTGGGAGGSDACITGFGQCAGSPSGPGAGVNKEMFIVSLDAPMTIGTTYDVSFKVIRPSACIWGPTPHIFDYGIKFISSSPSLCNGGVSATYAAPSSDPTPDYLITNANTISTGSWVTHSFSYTATAAHDRILVGFFDTPNSFNTSHINDAVQISFDDIVVETTSSLPVELIHFNPILNKDKVDLHWSTATERNNGHFIIERTTDGKSWTLIDQVSGHGNSTARIDYSTVDEQPESGRNYYRLKQVDFDGQFEYSGIRTIDYYPTSIHLFPNPVKNKLIISFENHKQEKFLIYDFLGKDVTHRITTQQQSPKTIECDLSQLPKRDLLHTPWNANRKK